VCLYTSALVCLFVCSFRVYMNVFVCSFVCLYVSTRARDIHMYMVYIVCELLLFLVVVILILFSPTKEFNYLNYLPQVLAQVT